MKGRHMRKKLLLIATLILLIAGSTYAGFSLLVSAEDSAIINVPNKDGISELGSQNNPLFILEIVPNRSYAEVGYWIAGCEPVDMERLAISDLAYTYQSRGFATCTPTTENKYVFEIDPAELASGDGKWYKSGEERGYYQKVTDGTGTIIQKQEGSDYIYSYVGAGKGQYVWVKNSDYSMPTDHTATKVWMTINRYSRNKMLFVHKNTFLKEAIGVPEAKISNYKSVVITVDPIDLANSTNLELIQKADIIYINGKSHDSGMVNIWKEFNKNGDKLTNTSTNFQGNNDLTWETTMAIFNRMVTKDRGVVVVDSTNVYLQTASTNNAHKLCIMLLQMGPSNFNRLLINTSKIKTTQVNGKTTGYYIGSDGAKKITAWDQYTFPDNNEKTKYGELLLKNPYITANNNTSVGEGVYSFNGNMSLLEHLATKDITEVSVTKEAFDWYEYYDKYLKDGANPNAPRRGSISPAEAIFSMLNQNFNWADKKELSILEIQPYDSFIYGSDGWETRYRKMFPNFMGNTSDIHVTTMTTYDYIGKIEDINAKYDLIVIGLNTGTKDIRKYNDTNLKGKVYLSIGDRVSTDDDIRYSGNDITKKKLEELKDFMLSGRPIVLASGFYANDTRSKVSWKVDKATYIYDLADVIREDNINVNTESAQADYRTKFKDKIFYEEKFNSYILEEKISSASCNIEFADKNNSNMYPVPYEYLTKADGSIATVTYHDTNTLKYRFRILGKGSSYTVKLYIDNNGDGRYNGSIDTPTTAKQEVLSNLKVVDDSNKSIRVSELKPNTWYTVTRRLDDSYQGIIPWKLEVNQVDNNSIRSSEINYTVIKQREEDKVQINVLQVAIDASSSDVNTNLNMSNDPRFLKYLASVPEYQVNITYMKNTEFLALYSRCTGTPIVNKYDFLKDYDMLILGFRDCCSYTNNPYANQNIKDFINQGKSVIFSHDVIWDKDAGTVRRYNSDLRKLLSQDRYNFNVGSVQSAQSIYYNDLTKTMKKIPLQIYADGISYSDSSYDKNWKFYTDNSNKLFWDYGNARNLDVRIPDRPTARYRDWETEKISIANKGQITQYPFKINDMISVSKTHMQYYQLDLEQDDMVVWYNLSDNYSKLNGGDNSGFYSSRENDSRNNYYIYNKGNITYTGLGHTGNLTNDEIKLFINTMISSYRAGFAQPKIVVTNEDVYTSGTDEQFLFINSDTGSVDVQDPSVVKTVQFKVEEASVINTSDREYYVSYYTNIPDPSDSTKTIRIQLNPTATYGSTDVLSTKNINNGTICAVTSGKGTKLNSDDEFSINVPLKYFQGKSQLVVEMELLSSGINEDGNKIELKSISKLNLVAKPLFDLD